MAALMNTYSPKDVTVSWFAKGFPGLKVVGLNQDSMIRLRRNGDITGRTIGAYGESSVTRLADETGTVEIELMQTSPTNLMFSGVFNAYQSGSYEQLATFVGDIVISDPSGSVLAYAAGCVPQSFPEVDLSGTDQSSRVWTFSAHKISFTAVPGQLGATLNDIQNLLSL